MERTLTLQVDERTRRASKTGRAKPPYCRYPVVGIPWLCIPYPDCPIALQEVGYLGAHLQLGELAPSATVTLRFSLRKPTAFLVFILDGCFRFADHEGRATPDGLAGTHYLAYNSGHTFSFGLHPGHHAILLIALDRDWLLPTAHRYPGFAPLLARWEAEAPGVAVLPRRPIGQRTRGHLEKLRTTIVRSLEQGIEVSQLILEIIDTYHALLVAKRGTQRKADLTDAWRIRRHIRQHLGDGASCLAHPIAEALGLSPWRVGQLCRKQFGLPLHEYLVQQRVHAAKHLLCRGDLKVRDIAYRVGFADADYFCRVFRRLVGKSPGGFRDGN